MKWTQLPEQPCLIARSVAILGDRWTMLILRDCFAGLRRFDQFQTSLGISRTIVTDRLNLLVAEGVLEKRPYQQNPPRHEYRLTAKGRDLYPVLLAIFDWGRQHYPLKDGLPVIHTHKSCGHAFTPVSTCSHCGEQVSAHDVSATRGPGLPA